MSRGRHALFRMLLVLFGVMLAFAIGEVAVRLSGARSELRRYFRPGIYMADPELGWRLRPDYRGVHVEYGGEAPTSTNPQGFRGPEWTPERKQAGLRVVALGDSCTFGLGVADHETLPSVLEEQLRAKGRDAAVFNAAVPGFDTVQELALLKRIGPVLRPHVILVGWLVNDAIGTSADFLQRFTVVEGHLMDDVREFEGWKRRIEKRGIFASALYRLYVESVKVLKYRAGHRRVYASSIHFREEQLRTTQSALLGIQEVGRELGAKVLLVLFPQEDEVNDPDADLAHHELMAKFADEHGIEVVRAPQAWRAARPVSGRYLERDPVHLNALGYRELASDVSQASVFERP